MKLINLINFYTKLFSILIINSSFSDSVSKNEKNILASHETTNLFQLGRNKYLLKKEVVKRLADDNIRHYKILLVGDIYEKGFTVSLRNQCKNEGIHLKLIVVVLSNPLSFFARNSIRETWGVGNKDVQIIFLFGSHTDSWTEKHLKEEENTYNDIVRGHFLDSYSNFTLKTVSALEWIATYCSKAKFMLKVHDNVFINMPYLKTFVKTHMNYQNAIFARFVQVENKSIANSSLFLKEENISNSSAVIMGHTYLITIDSIKKLYNQTLKKYLINPIVNFCNFILKQYYSKINEIKDIFLTNNIAQELAIERFNVFEFACDSKHTDPCKINKCISLNNVKSDQQHEFWKKLFTCSENCSQFRCFKSSQKFIKSSWKITFILLIVNCTANCKLL